MTRESPRIRRLRTDFKALTKLKEESSILDFSAPGALYGGPPESYVVRFNGKGLWRAEGNSNVLVREVHEVSINLGAAYPRMMPELAWRTPIFHPNISGSGVVCIGGYGTYWVPSLNLDELCGMLWDMVRYKNFDVNSPYNREAALWAKTQRQYTLPVDRRPLRDRLAGQAAPQAAKPPIVGAPADLEMVELELADVMFIDADEVVDAEIVEPDDPDVLFIE